MLQEHLYQHEETQFKCAECKLGFLHQGAYELHVIRNKWNQQKGRWRTARLYEKLDSLRELPSLLGDFGRH